MQVGILEAVMFLQFFFHLFKNEQFLEELPHI